MNVDIQQHGTVAVLVPRGPLSGDDVTDFRREMSRAVESRGGRVVVDMAAVPFLDSAGIEAVSELCKPQAGALLQPRLANLGETCREAMFLTDTLEPLAVFDSVENAIRSFRQ